TIFDHQHRAIGHAVDRTFAALGIDDHHFTRAGQRQPAAALVGDGRHVAEHDLAIADRFDVAGLVDLCRTADVEGTHGQLGARLTDRLRGDNADSFTDVDRSTACKVTAVA